MAKAAKPASKGAEKSTNGDGTNVAATDVGAEGQAATGAAPSMKILGQYLKDLSFENPNAPASLATQGEPPEINISVNVNAKNLAPTDYEVELHLEAKASRKDEPVFVADMLYAGIFRLENIPQEALSAIILVECPRMIFPFARVILADATRNGGFPPLMLDPIDFAGMFQRRMAEQQAQQASASA